jgi:hypothetical protein
MSFHNSIECLDSHLLGAFASLNFVIFAGNSGKRATVSTQMKSIFTNEITELADSR